MPGTTVAELLQQGNHSFVSFAPEFMQDPTTASMPSTVTMPLLMQKPFQQQPVAPPVAVRPRLAPNYTGLEQLKLPFPSQKNSVSVLNELMVKAGENIEITTEEVKDENKGFGEKYDFANTEMEKWRMWKSRFQTTIKMGRLHDTPIVGDWCSLKQQSCIVAAESALMVVYGQRPQKLWEILNNKKKPVSAKALKAAPVGAVTPGNLTSKVNEILQKRFRKWGTGPMMEWTYQELGGPRIKGKGIVAHCWVGPLEQSFEGTAQQTKKEAQKDTLNNILQFITQ